MKHAFILVQLVFGCGFFAGAVAHFGTSVPFDLSDLAKVVAGYAAACLLAIAAHDYSRGAVRRPPPPPAPVAEPQTTPRPRPAPSLPAASAAVLSHTLTH